MKSLRRTSRSSKTMMSFRRGLAANPQSAAYVGRVYLRFFSALWLLLRTMWMSWTSWCNRLLYPLLCYYVEHCVMMSSYVTVVYMNCWSWYVHGSHSVCLLKPGVTVDHPHVTKNLVTTRRWLEAINTTQPPLQWHPSFTSIHSLHISIIWKLVRNEARYVVHVGANFSGRPIPNQRSYRLLASCNPSFVIPAHYASRYFDDTLPHVSSLRPRLGASPRRRCSLRHLILFAPSATGLFRPRSLRHCDHAGFYPVRHHYAFQLLVAFLVLGFVSSVC
jgi:hypothetical protein